MKKGILFLTVLVLLSCNFSKIENCGSDSFHSLNLVNFPIKDSYITVSLFIDDSLLWEENFCLDTFYSDVRDTNRIKTDLRLDSALNIKANSKIVVRHANKVFVIDNFVFDIVPQNNQCTRGEGCSLVSYKVNNSLTKSREIFIEY